MKSIYGKIIILALSIGLCFLPTDIVRAGYSYNFTYRTFFLIAHTHQENLFSATIIFDTLLTLLSFGLVVTCVLYIINSTRVTQTISTTFVGINILLWLIRIFVPLKTFDGNRSRPSLLRMFDGRDIWCLLLYFAVLLTLLVLIVVPYIKTSHHPSRVEQLEARVAELEKQIQDNDKD